MSWRKYGSRCPTIGWPSAAVTRGSGLEGPGPMSRRVGAVMGLATFEPAELLLRSHEGEPRPPPAVYGPMEVLLGLCRIALHQVPVAQTEREGRDLYGFGVGRRKQLRRLDLALVETNALHVPVAGINLERI